MPPPLPYFKVNIYPFPLPHFASIYFKISFNETDTTTSGLRWIFHMHSEFSRPAMCNNGTWSSPLNYIVTLPRYFSFRLPHLNIPTGPPSDELDKNIQRTSHGLLFSHWNGYSHFRSGLNWFRKYIKCALNIKCQYFRLPHLNINTGPPSDELDKNIQRKSHFLFFSHWNGYSLLNSFPHGRFWQFVYKENVRCTRLMQRSLQVVIRQMFVLCSLKIEAQTTF
jgi:hypothetical protein